MKGWLVIALLVIACDSRATSDPGRSERSREYETCSTSVDCKDELRCFDHTCRRTARSTVGDYFAAHGALAKQKGDLEQAINDYTQALAHYDAEKIALPPDVDCAYGAALAAAAGNKEHAEMGARVLHRCLLAVPAGSRLREQALAALAPLGDAGLDPVLLGANKVADKYLTKEPSRPSSDKVQITVTANPQPTGKSYQQIPDKLKEPDMRAALVGCWDTYTNATKKEAMTTTVGLKVSYIPSEYEDESGTYSAKLDPQTGATNTPEAAAETCVRGVLDPMIKGLKITDAFATKLTVNIK